MRQNRIFAAVSSAAVVSLFAGTVQAANPEPVVVDVEFVAPITITEINSLDFGLIDVNMANGDTIALATDSSFVDSGSRVIGGTPAAAALTVTATAGAAINILVNNVSPGTYYSLGAFQCDYDSAGAAACDGAGINTNAVGSATLTVGATLTKNATPAVVGQDDGSFDVTIAYQ